MAYDSGITTNTYKELLESVFAGKVTGDFKLALYGVGTTQNPLTSLTFGNTGEIVADNYVAGGIPMPVPTITSTTINTVPSVIVTFQTAIVPNTTATVQSWAVYEVATLKVFACGGFADGSISSTNSGLEVTIPVGALGVGLAG